jgi:hypothetical protein
MITSSEPASLVPARTTPDAHPDTRLQEGQYEVRVPVPADMAPQFPLIWTMYGTGAGSMKP